MASERMVLEKAESIADVLGAVAADRFGDPLHEYVEERTRERPASAHLIDRA